MSDLVNHPPHYEEQSIKLEPIDFCERLPFNLGNALKYCFRAGHKEGSSELQDLDKAKWYLKRQAESRFALSLTAVEKQEFAYMYMVLQKDKGIIGRAINKFYDQPVKCNFSFWNALEECIENRIKVIVALEEVARSNPLKDKK